MFEGLAKIDWSLILLGAVIVVGLLQALKNVSKVKAWPAWAWTSLTAGASVLAAVVVYFLPPWINLCFLVFAVAQLGYENVVKLIGRIIDKIGSKE